jgi:non-ribosomal peptide synthetase component F
LTSRLEALARKQRVTLYTLLLAAYQAFLHRYCGQDDILVGSIMSGRTQPRFERVIGYLANPVVMRADLTGDPPFTEFLAQVWQTVQEAIDHQNYPFSMLVERLLVQRDPSRGPLVDTIFILQRPQKARSSEEKKGDREVSPFGVVERREKGAQLAIAGSSVELFLVEHHIAKFDLELEMFAVGDELSGWFRYCTDLFDAETVAAMSSNFLTLLQGIVEYPGRRLSELPLLSAVECRAVLAASAPRRRLRTYTSLPASAPVARLSKPMLAKP